MVCSSRSICWTSLALNSGVKLRFVLMSRFYLKPPDFAVRFPWAIIVPVQAHPPAASEDTTPARRVGEGQVVEAYSVVALNHAGQNLVLKLVVDDGRVGNVKWHNWVAEFIGRLRRVL